MSDDDVTIKSHEQGEIHSSAIFKLKLALYSNAILMKLFDSSF